jgi:hypothetical protein
MLEPPRPPSRVEMAVIVGVVLMMVAVVGVAFWWTW